MDWNDCAGTWDADEGARAYSTAAFESVARLCEEQNVSLKSARACDFGCGTGLLSEKLAAAGGDVVAVDSSEKMIQVLREKIVERGLDRIAAVAAVLDHDYVADSALFAAPFDLITCSSVCAFLDDYPGTVQLLAKQLRPGGLFIQWDWELDPTADEPFGLSRDAVKSALSGSGLAPVYVGKGFTVRAGEEVMSPLMGVGRASARGLPNKDALR